KRKYGVSPAGYVIKERIRLGCRMLVEDEKLSISDISVAVGYKDPLYFSRIFKKQTGVSPTEYRQLHTDELF
ncbi:MAG: AraC family transcriptional regulator, partial [Clostridia bacterium]|nr:AraC family transcriptional regulator [Clostridia bacterium]